jgi:hypothetical protein
MFPNSFTIIPNTPHRIEQRYEIAPIRYWKNLKTGQTASLFGSLPYISDFEGADWSVVENGYGWWDKNSNTFHGTHGQTRAQVVERIKKFYPSFVDTVS